jgi:hypothetical protein
MGIPLATEKEFEFARHTDPDTSKDAAPIHVTGREQDVR